MSLQDAWPLFGLELRSPNLHLRIVRDEDLSGLLAAVEAGIHDPDVMPFGVPWTDAEPEALRRGFAQYQWGKRSRVRAGTWDLSFAVLREGVPIGIQDVSASDFGVRRTVTTGSWLTRAQQGLGLGKEMRAATLLFAFDHLGAEFAESSAATWNRASLAVSRALGYEDNGRSRVVKRPGEAQTEQRVRLERDAFKRPDWTLGITGLEAALPELLD
ncbi:GNAT family N-acetyltransferase [Amnibacterium kyonggiense]|uniref:RimJ/RimL family protein N-acetyltransferase n=1 Tax=Amnibacterium kyonggiense TaxID=595671 RepID=A0A4R7FG88_9MICO|nr:GNAT family N-acetyltransferase [Amnibacterium kyonggiense]TDS75950.1 RimJ/RimL family protein N-acetyltransferase [Amnibacterium kyonggiense]